MLHTLGTAIHVGASTRLVAQIETGHVGPPITRRLVRLPRSQGVLGADIVGSFRFSGRAEGSLFEVLEERRKAWDTGHDNAEIGLDCGPHDQGRAVGVYGQSLDCHDADDLDDGDEDAEAEEAEENDFLSVLHVEVEQHGERQKHAEKLRSARRQRAHIGRALTL